MTAPQRLRIGVLSMDAIRLEGLQAVLEEVAVLLPMSAPSAARETELAMVILDGHDEHLMEFMAAFRRARPGLRLMVLGASTEARHIQQVVAGGAKGYLSYTASAAEIRTAVEVVADGSIWAPRKVLASLIDTYSPAVALPVAIYLTPREREIVALLVQGWGNREIGQNLKIETKTVKTHVSRLLQKFGVPNRVAMTVRAIELNILDSQE